MRFLPFLALITSVLSISSRDTSAQNRFTEKQKEKTQEKIKRIDKTKWNVCSITINSDDEIKMFKRKLPSKDFNFIELTDFGKFPSEKKSKKKDIILPDSQAWFKEACESNVECHMLIISGHFTPSGRTFYGDSEPGQIRPYELSLDTLKSYSCSNSCQGILNNPIEVFMFGCNTFNNYCSNDLSEVELQRQEAGLIKQGLTPQQAQNITRAMRSSMGKSVKSTMQEVFSGVRSLYGFDGVAPIGAVAKTPLEKVIHDQSVKHGSYSDYLGSKLLTIGMRNREETHHNPSWSSHFQNYNGVQCSNEEVFMEDSFKWMSGVKSISCSLRDQNRTQLEKFKVLDELMNYKILVDYLPDVAFFLKQVTEPLSNEERVIFEKLKNNEQIKSDFISVIRKLPLSEFLEDSLAIALKLNWVTLSEYESEMRRATLGVLNQELFTNQTKDYICQKKNESFLNELRLKAQTIDESRINASLFESKYGLEILKCLGINSEILYENIRKHSLSNSDETTRVLGLQILKQNLSNPKNLEAYVDHTVKIIANPRTEYWVNNVLFEDLLKQNSFMFANYYHGEYFAEPSEKTIKKIHQLIQSKQNKEEGLGQFQSLFLLSVLGRNPNPSAEDKKIYWSLFDKIQDHYTFGPMYHLNPKFYENNEDKKKEIKLRLGSFYSIYKQQDVALRYLKMAEKHPALFEEQPLQSLNNLNQKNSPFTDSWFEHAFLMYYLEDSHERGIQALKSNLEQLRDTYSLNAQTTRAKDTLQQLMIRDKDGDEKLLIDMLSGSKFWYDVTLFEHENPDFEKFFDRSLARVSHPDTRILSTLESSPLTIPSFLVLAKEPKYLSDSVLKKAIIYFIKQDPYALSLKSLENKVQQYVMNHVSKDKIRDLSLTWAIENSNQAFWGDRYITNLITYLDLSKERPLSKESFDQLDAVLSTLNINELNNSREMKYLLFKIIREHPYFDKETTQECVKRFVSFHSDYTRKFLTTLSLSKSQISKMKVACKNSDWNKQNQSVCGHVLSLGEKPTQD